MNDPLSAVAYYLSQDGTFGEMQEARDLLESAIREVCSNMLADNDLIKTDEKR